VQSTTVDNAHEAPSPREPFTTTDRHFQEAIGRFRQAGEALTAERDRLQRLLDATAGGDQPPDEAAAP
jgi:hypothetical protein